MDAKARERKKTGACFKLCYETSLVPVQNPDPKLHQKVAQCKRTTDQISEAHTGCKKHGIADNPIQRHVSDDLETLRQAWALVLQIGLPARPCMTLAPARFIVQSEGLHASEQQASY
jgi:hypothetical protein